MILFFLYARLEMFYATCLAFSYPSLKCLLTEMAVMFRNGHYRKKIDSHCMVQLNVARILGMSMERSNVPFSEEIFSVA